MKKNILGLALTISLLASQSQAAPELACSYKDFSQDPDSISAIHDRLQADCTDRKGDQYQVTLVGVGIGLRITYAEGFILTCPLVEKSNFVTESYEGLRLDSSYIVGPDVAILSNKNLGFCALTGAGFGFGVSVSVDRMTIEKK